MEVWSISDAVKVVDKECLPFMMVNCVWLLPRGLKAKAPSTQLVVCRIGAQPGMVSAKPLHQPLIEYVNSYC